MNKTIVVFYSLTNNTKEAAKQVASQLNADLMQLHMVRDMPKNQGKIFMTGGMQAIFGMRPNLKEYDIRPEDYEEIIVGTPIWAGKNASPINTFFREKAICQKVTGIFTLSGGGDNDQCVKILKKKLPNLKYIVALADRANDLSMDNSKKITKFTEEMTGGKE